MSNLTFPDFTLSAPPSLTDYLVGYATAVAGGERRTTLQSVSDLLGTGYFGSLTANRLLLGQANGTLASSDLTYSTPTLTTPDGFNISSAGSIALTAGGSNKSVSIKSSGTAYTFMAKTGTSTPIAAWLGTATPVFFTGGETSVGDGDYLGAYASDTSANRVSFTLKRARGTLAVPTTVADTDAVGSFIFSNYDGTSFNNNALIGALVDGAVSTGITPTRLIFEVGLTNTRVRQMELRPSGQLRVGLTGVTVPAWSTTGVNFASLNRTMVDSSSATGTVASAVFNSFAVPTINATNASVVYTNLANVYIAGDPLTTGNASATNSYGLWNVGKTRLDGNVGIGGGSSASTRLGLAAGTTAISSLRIPHGAAPTSPVDGDMWTTTAGLFIRINGATVGPLS